MMSEEEFLIYLQKTRKYFLDNRNYDAYDKIQLDIEKLLGL